MTTSQSEARRYEPEVVAVGHHSSPSGLTGVNGDSRQSMVGDARLIVRHPGLPEYSRAQPLPTSLSSNADQSGQGQEREKMLAMTETISSVGLQLSERDSIQPITSQSGRLATQKYFTDLSKKAIQLEQSTLKTDSFLSTDNSCSSQLKGTGGRFLAGKFQPFLSTMPATTTTGQERHLLPTMPSVQLPSASQTQPVVSSMPHFPINSQSFFPQKLENDKSVVTIAPNLTRLQGTGASLNITAAINPSINTTTAVPPSSVIDHLTSTANIHPRSIHSYPSVSNPQLDYSAFRAEPAPILTTGVATQSIFNLHTMQSGEKHHLPMPPSVSTSRVNTLQSSSVATVKLQNVRPPLLGYTVRQCDPDQQPNDRPASQQLGHVQHDGIVDKQIIPQGQILDPATDNSTPSKTLQPISQPSVRQLSGLAVQVSLQSTFKQEQTPPSFKDHKPLYGSNISHSAFPSSPVYSAADAGLEQKTSLKRVHNAIAIREENNTTVSVASVEKREPQNVISCDESDCSRNSSQIGDSSEMSWPKVELDRFNPSVVVPAPQQEIKSEVVYDRERPNTKATMTDPQLRGPEDRISLDGMILNETEGGLLVVNVMYNGKDYMGTLMDCTSPSHTWASPRHSDIPPPDKRPKKKKTKGESEIELSARASLRNRRNNQRRQKKTRKRKWEENKTRARHEK